MRLGRCNAKPARWLDANFALIRVLKKRDLTFRNPPLGFVFRLYLHHSLLGRSYKQFTLTAKHLPIQCERHYDLNAPGIRLLPITPLGNHTIALHEKVY
jgi:hypothetical protein